MGVAIFFALVILNAAKTLQTVWTPSFALTVSERSLLQSAQQSTCGSTLHYCSFLRGVESVHVTMPKNVYLCGIRRLYLRAARSLRTAQQLVTRRLVYCRQHNNQPEILIMTYCCLVKRQFVGTRTARLSRPNNYHRRSRLCIPLYIVDGMQHNMQWPVEPPLSMIVSL